MVEIEICSHGQWIQNCKPCRERRKQSVPTFKGADNAATKNPENSTHFYGHPWAEWFAMRDAGVDILHEYGGRRRLITYPDLWAEIEVRLGRSLRSTTWEVGRLLEDIHDESGIDERFMLTAIVIDGKNEVPSQGFFRLASRRHLLPEINVPKAGQEEGKLTLAQWEFWEDQKTGVLDILLSSKIELILSETLSGDR